MDEYSGAAGNDCYDNVWRAGSTNTPRNAAGDALSSRTMAAFTVAAGGYVTVTVASPKSGLGRAASTSYSVDLDPILVVAAKSRNAAVDVTYYNPSASPITVPAGTQYVATPLMS